MPYRNGRIGCATYLSQQLREVSGGVVEKAHKLLCQSHELCSVLRISMPSRASLHIQKFLALLDLIAIVLDGFVEVVLP